MFFTCQNFQTWNDLQIGRCCLEEVHQLYQLFVAALASGPLAVGRLGTWCRSQVEATRGRHFRYGEKLDKMWVFGGDFFSQPEDNNGCNPFVFFGNGFLPIFVM